jgi:hypothetical protein
MPWVELFPATAELTLKNGVLSWNTALHISMGDPPWVELLHDAANGWVGIRSANSATGLPVIDEPEAGEFKIDSYDLLDAAGVPVAITVSASPPNTSQAVVPTSPDQSPAYSARHPVYYVELP